MRNDAFGRLVEARCPFIAAYLRRHPDDADLVWAAPAAMNRMACHSGKFHGMMASTGPSG